MENLQDAYRDDDDSPSSETPFPPSSELELELEPEPKLDSIAVQSSPFPEPESIPAPMSVEHEPEPKPDQLDIEAAVKLVHLGSEPNRKLPTLGSEEIEGEFEEDTTTTTTIEVSPSSKKHKSLDIIITPTVNVNGIAGTSTKKSSKKKTKNNSVWTKPTSRKGKKKAKNFNGSNNGGNHSNDTPKAEDSILVTPLPRLPDKNDDSPDLKVTLSKVYKAEKVELSEDRLSASSCKGYRMVRATRGVSEGAWFFEIKVMHLGESGHTRLGFSNDRGDLQAPVGYDGNSFGFRDVDGSKIHKALREKYGEDGYKEGDVIGFYISLPEGELFAPKGPHLVMYKGQKFVCDAGNKEDPPKIVPGSEISFYKNGICQGVAFKDLFGGRYYPAASMYTLPNQPNCVVKFNFGPDFECFPADFEGRPVPRPMIEVPYHGYDNRVENSALEENNQ